MNIRRMIIPVVLLIMIAIVGGCGSSASGNEGEPEYKFKMSNVSEESNVVSAGLEKFAELANSKSDGRIQIDVIHGAQLGTGVETFEAVRNGNLDFAADSFANLNSVTPAFEIFHLPFLFESKEQAWNAVLDENVMGLVNEELGEQGVRFFSVLDMGGPRQIATTDFKIEKINDLTGKSIRASRSPMEVAMHEAWGAAGQTVDWPEVPESLRLGMVDGVTVSYPYIRSASLHEGNLVKYIADVNAQWFSYVTVVNQDMWDGLPEDIQEILTEAAREAEEWHHEYVGEKVEEDIQILTEAGVEIYTLPEETYEELKEMTIDKVWDQFIGDPGISQEKLDLIQEAKGPVGDKGWGYTIPE
ncbi:TRAP transporter substrate-binding protein [Pseudogracilibacillus auburnensis]|uniref:TRAP transporter substrate-binding protein n=1 Tax=Pseudogracilibacillus auburnensis TaxID=1494959 RepID=UPI001A97D31C|nr:TRAP transporter substrate-binding protein [Pseudogracilibacillus auburnensis]MBO1001855.1 TRAP transporter substrate-binding protein [Pseudogracilibacillus auburnensis]